jgi:hypothetical protein
MRESAADVLERSRASVVGVISATNRGSGYVALPNGLIVTSLDVVGYERDVQIVVDGGHVIPGLVLRANVPLDVALVVPREHVGLPPLEPSHDCRLGDRVVLLGRMGVEPAVCDAIVASVERVSEGFAHVQIDASPDELMRGAPLLDLQGRVLGMLVRPRRSRGHGDRSGLRWLSNLVLPCTAYEGGLASADGPLEEVFEYQPEYGCSHCDTVFEPDMDRCLECGATLPHRWSRTDGPPPAQPPPLRGLFAVKAALASMGIPASRAQVGPRTWRFSPSFQEEHQRAQVDVTTDDRGDLLILRAPVVRLPREGYESFYRHLLTLNDESAGIYRFSVFDGTAYLSSAEPVGAVDAVTFPSAVSDFTASLARYRSRFVEAFGAEPAFEHESD